MRWPLRCRTFESLAGSLILTAALRDRRRQHGRTVQVHVRATARTNGGASAPVTTPGTCSKPQSPFACGTQAYVLLPWLCLPCAFSTRLPCAPAHGAAGAVKRPVVPHAPSGEKEQDDRRALEPDTHGAMTRVCSRCGDAAARTPTVRLLSTSGCLTIEFETQWSGSTHHLQTLTLRSAWRRSASRRTRPVRSRHAVRGSAPAFDPSRRPASLSRLRALRFGPAGRATQGSSG